MSVSTATGFLRRAAVAVAAFGFLACASDARGDRTLRLDIEPPASTPVVHEPVSVRLTLTNDGPDTPVPLDYLDADVLTLTLCDAAGRLLATADGYATEVRLGGQPSRVRPESMRTVPLPAGRAMQWTVDLNEYFDLDEPGEYGVEAQFRFPPSGVDARSGRAAFTLAPNACGWMSLHADQVAIALVMTLERHDGADGSRTLVRFARPGEPFHVWKGYVVPVPPGARARISQADFMTVDTFAHDFQRWIAWIGSEGAGGIRLDDAGAVAATLAAPMEAGATLAGNPVQHADHGVTLIALSASAGMPTLVARRFDAEGAPAGARTVAEYATQPAPLVVSSDWNGRVYALSAAGGRLPVELVVDDGAGAPRRLPLLPAGTLPDDLAGAGARILALRLDTQLVMARARAALVLLEVGQREESRLLAVRVPLAEDGSPSGLPVLTDVAHPYRLLESVESIAAAVVAQGPGGLHVAVTSSSGRVMYIGPGLPAREAAEVPAAAIGQADLLAAGGGVHLVHPSADRGMRHVAVVEPPARP